MYIHASFINFCLVTDDEDYSERCGMFIQMFIINYNVQAYYKWYYVDGVFNYILTAMTSMIITHVYIPWGFMNQYLTAWSMYIAMYVTYVQASTNHNYIFKSNHNKYLNHSILVFLMCKQFLIG